MSQIPAQLINAVATFQDAAGDVACVVSFGPGELTEGGGVTFLPWVEFHRAGSVPCIGELCTGRGQPIPVTITDIGGGGDFEVALPLGAAPAFEPAVFTTEALADIPVPVSWIEEPE